MKFSFRFRDWRIQTKLLVIFIVLSWIPVVILMGLNLLEQLNASQIEMENQLLRVVSSTVRDIQINASKYIKDNHVVLQSISDDSILVDALVSVGEIPVIIPEPGEGGPDAGLSEPPASPTPPPTPEKGAGPPSGGSPSPPGEGGPPPDGQSPPGDSSRDIIVFPNEGVPSELFSNEFTEAASAFLGDYELANDGQQEIGLLNTQSVVIASSQEDAQGMIAFGRSDIEVALTGVQYTENLHLNPDNNVPGFFIAVPVYNDSEVIGVLSSRLLAQFIIDELSSGTDEDTNIQTELDIFLVNSYGVIMAHSNAEYAWLYHSLGELSESDLAEIEGNHLLGNLGNPIEIAALQPLADVLRDSFTSGATGTISFCMPSTVDAVLDENCDNGSIYSAGYDPLRDPITDEILFTIVTTIPEAQFVDPIKRQAAFSIGGAAVMSFLLFAVAFVIARTMAQPIKTLMSAAETVESEEPFDPETLESISAQKDELGKLATVFTKMAKVVQEREQQLRKTVEKLRIEIDQSKRKKEVDEIVEGDFFKDLQDKAREAKEQRRKAEEEDEESKKD